MSLQMKPAVIQAAKAKKKKKQNANAKLYAQAMQNWSSYACYETSTAKAIARRFDNENAIYTYMINHKVGGADSYPGHCSGGTGSKKNHGTQAMLDKIRKAFGF